jgi:hypothetical protein
MADRRGRGQRPARSVRKLKACERSEYSRRRKAIKGRQSYRGAVQAERWDVDQRAARSLRSIERAAAGGHWPYNSRANATIIGRSGSRRVAREGPGHRAMSKRESDTSGRNAADTGRRSCSLFLGAAVQIEPCGPQDRSAAIFGLTCAQSSGTERRTAAPTRASTIS